MQEELEAQDFGGDQGPQLDLREYFLMFRRRWRLLTSIIVGVLLLVVLVTFQTRPKYTATASVLVERQQQQVVDLSTATAGVLPTDSASVDTEAEVMKSRSLAEKVVTDLQLDSDPEFSPSEKASASPLAGAGRGVNAGDLARRHFELTVDSVLKALAVKRQGLTYVIELSFTSHDPAKAAKVVNRFAARYLTEQVDSKVDANERNRRELYSRLESVRKDAEDADAELQQYKIANNLLSNQGASLTEQELSNLNQQMATVTLAQAEAQARLNTARRQLARGSAGDDVGEALSSPVIQTLRAQRAQASQLAASLADRYGPLYPDRVKADTEVADIDKQIKAEIRRIVSNLEAQVEVAHQRTASMEASMGKTQGTLEANSRATTQLNILQNKANAAKAIYEAFLSSFKQASASQGLQQSGARIVAQAKIPTRASSPNKPLNLALGLLLGLGAGVGAVFLRESLDSGLTTAEGVEQQMDTPYLGGIPSLDSVSDDTDEQLDPEDYLVKKPLSSFAESYRNLRTSISFSRPGHPVHVVAVTSTLPGEGKTTTSWCLARTAALAGQRVVLVDCDLRRRTASHKLKEVPRVGLIEVLNNLVPLEEALTQDSETSAMILPVSRSAQTVKDVFGTPAMEALINQLKAQFDIVILDTAPVIAVSETRVIGREADAVVVLARWRKTPRKAIEAALRALTSAGAYVSGVSLTMIDAKQQERYGYGDPGYYYSSYSKYYTDDSSAR